MNCLVHLPYLSRRRNKGRDKYLIATLSYFCHLFLVNRLVATEADGFLASRINKMFSKFRVVNDKLSGSYFGGSHPTGHNLRGNIWRHNGTGGWVREVSL